MTVPQMKREEPSGRSFHDMGLMDHLHDLRSCLVHCIACVVLLSFVTYFYSTIFFDWLSAPIKTAFGENILIGTGPAEALTLKFTISFFAGIIAGLPYIFYQVWKFISPGLHDDEKKYVWPFVIVTTACFIAGVIFCYQVVLPVSFIFFKDEYASIHLQPQIRLTEYLSLTIKLLAGFGVIFELPVLSFVLGRLGILTSGYMISAYRYVIVGIFVVAGVLTPPDAMSQILMAGPMLILYGVSILVVKLSERPREQS